jgi:hypothetical protein
MPSPDEPATRKEEGMSKTGFIERSAPLAGVGAVASVLAGLLVLHSTNEPGDAATPQQVLAYLDSKGNGILLGSLLCMLGLVAFVWFLAALRTRLAEAEGGSGFFSGIAFGGGLLSTAFLAFTLVPLASGAIAVQDEHNRFAPDAAQALMQLSSAAYSVAYMTMSIPLIATAVVALRTAALPRALGYASAVLGVVMLVPFADWLAFGFLFPLWLVACSVALARRPARPAAVQATAGVATA